jgi:hypothetical protein
MLSLKDLLLLNQPCIECKSNPRLSLHAKEHRKDDAAFEIKTTIISSHQAPIFEFNLTTFYDNRFSIVIYNYNTVQPIQNNQPSPYTFISFLDAHVLHFNIHCDRCKSNIDTIPLIFTQSNNLFLLNPTSIKTENFTFQANNHFYDIKTNLLSNETLFTLTKIDKARILNHNSHPVFQTTIPAITLQDHPDKPTFIDKLDLIRTFD